ncbi:MAG: alpha/beta fold hydrolase [Fimbriimonas sp.]
MVRGVHMKSKFNLSLGILALATLGHSQAQTTYHFAQVDGHKVFYREAGPKNAKTIVLLHGFPSSSHMFRDLIPKLATKYHVVAPDYIGFGYSDVPSRASFAYTFANLASITDKLLAQTGNTRYTLYVQDYGGPVGFRLATAHHERVEGLIVQNSNAYLEGISKLAFGVLAEFGKNRNAETEKPVRGLLGYEGIKYGYVQGSPNPAAISPDSYTFDNALFQAKPENEEIQLDLFADYQSNVALYPQWQAYFRKYQPRTLIVWGKGDPFFTVAGSKAYARDLKHVVYNLYDAGHFALEEKGPEIAAKILSFLGRK